MPSVGIETERQEHNKKEPSRRFVISLTVLFGSVGVVWDVLAAMVVFHTYTFFESVVVCLLVMILCVVITLRVHFQQPLGIFHHPTKDNAAERSDLDTLEEKLRGSMKVLFYGIAFIMALIKLVMTLLG